MVEAANIPRKRNWFSPVRDLFTEKDGVTWDFVRVFGAGGILWFMACETFAVSKGQPFNPETVGIGLSGLIVSVAGGIAARSLSKSENTGEGQ